MKLDLPHASLGTVPSVACPIKFNNTPIEYTSGPPTLGQHTDEVLSNVVKLEEASIKELKNRNII